MAGTVALTGATGFIGGHVARHLVDAGWRVRALTRRGADALPAGVTAAAGSLEDGDSLTRLVAGADAVVHCAGLVRARSRAEFEAVNAAGTARLARAARARSPTPRFVLISSLAAREPALSPYAASKRAGEQALAGEGMEMAWVALRPPAVYGPGDRATLAFFRGFQSGLMLYPGARGGRISLIHAGDLAGAVAALLAGDMETGAIIEVHDGHAGGYTWPEMAAAAGRALKKNIICLRIPKPIMHIASALNAVGCRFGGGAPMLTRGKVRELYHRDWGCRENPLTDAVGWRPGIAIDAGFAETLAWYRDHGWL